MTVEIKPNFILISDILNGYLFKRKYIGYSIEEAKQMFEIECEEQESFERNALNGHWKQEEGL